MGVPTFVDEWTARTDMSTYSKECALRTPGHLTVFFNIWRMMLRTEGKLEGKELQCIHFTN